MTSLLGSESDKLQSFAAQTEENNYNTLASSNSLVQQKQEFSSIIQSCAPNEAPLQLASAEKIFARDIEFLLHSTGTIA